LICSSY